MLLFSKMYIKICFQLYSYQCSMWRHEGRSQAPENTYGGLSILIRFSIFYHNDVFGSNIFILIIVLINFGGVFY